ncbi:hypothetical protein ABID56_001000 [Alkalibacillus flavidus]|uniref:HNH endonuclease n=1 Tax=Alkalibacillus flavidus TaxID=546021 RepID=A0ABV2KTK1_9BACI
MNLRKPIATNKVDKPVIIFKNGAELEEFPSIPSAAKWFKRYLNYKYVPYATVINGIFHDKVWNVNGDTYAFTTDENVRLAKLEELNKKSKKTEPTGYWTFFCNPKRWKIDDFLKSGEVFDTFSITDWQKNWFNKGQLGVIRVGRDNRTIKELDGRARLKPGIYALVEILDQPSVQTTTKEAYWSDENEGKKARYRVPIKYIKNLIDNPILFEDLNLSSDIADKHLIEGFQASSIPLNGDTFNIIFDEMGEVNYGNFDYNNANIDLEDTISKLEKRYINAVPEVKEWVSKYIERGIIAQQYKRKTNFKCQICEALEFEPYSFKKPNGEYYIETHHVIPVSELHVGSLATHNLLTLCANHHRQLHYGNVELINNSEDKFIFRINDNQVKVNKIK